MPDIGDSNDGYDGNDGISDRKEGASSTQPDFSAYR